jgi:plastocyanin
MNHSEDAMRVARSACLVITSALLGCGGGGDDGGPTDPPPGNNQTLGSITTSVTSFNVNAGNSQTITVQARDAQGGVITNAPAPTFSAANAGIAEVDGGGVVLGVSAGSTTINVSLTMSGVTKTAAVAVTVSGTLANQVDVVAGTADFVFTPKNVAVKAGGSVTWTFGTLSHTVTFVATTGAPASIAETVSATASRTFNTAGDFTYNCTIHAGMSGKVIVR